MRLVPLALLTAAAPSLAECAATPAPASPAVVPAAIDNCGTRVLHHTMIAALHDLNLAKFDLLQIGEPT